MAFHKDSGLVWQKQEKIPDRILRPMQEFLARETTSGVILLLATIFALFLANSGWAHIYEEILHNDIVVGIGKYQLSHSIHFWINDGLMGIFFLVVGLEIKREILTGALSTAKKAILPIIAAVGGAILPAIIFFAVAGHTEAAHGWGIPMATDIAFAVGVLTLLGSRVPLSLKILITALAIADDLIAVIIIAIFYSSEIVWTNVGIGLIFWAGIWLLNINQVKSLLLYLVLGGFVWYMFLYSGIHATIAGVLVAIAIPASRAMNAKEFSKDINTIVKRFDGEIKRLEDEGFTDENYPPTYTQSKSIHQLESYCEYMLSPLRRMEHALHPWVAYGIMPLFALANAGVKLDANFVGLIIEPMSLGIILGLIFGKTIGVSLFTWLVVKLKWAELPGDVNWQHVIGMSIVCGIGFTMSLFIANLAFVNEAHLLTEAKTGVLVGSTICGVLGYMFLRALSKKQVANTAKS